MVPKCNAHLCYMYKSQNQIKGAEEKTSSPHTDIHQGSNTDVTGANHKNKEGGASSHFTFIIVISVPPSLARSLPPSHPW